MRDLLLTSFGASLLMVFSDSHHTAAPATGMDTAMPAHHKASFLASAELNMDRLLLVQPSLMMLFNGLLGVASIECRLHQPLISLMSPDECPNCLQWQS